VVLRQKTRLSRKPDTWQYSWDAEDRLTRVVTPDGTVWRYLYDPLGRRIGKQRLAGNGVDVLEQVDFAWDGTSMCEQTTSWADSVDSVTLTWHLNGAEAVARASAGPWPRPRRKRWTPASSRSCPISRALRAS
jgi:YD repeat-containing protein